MHPEVNYPTYSSKMTSQKGGYQKKKFWRRAKLHSAESIFRQFAAEYLREFEAEFEHILGC
jgi:hypothetical protein